MEKRYKSDNIITTTRQHSLLIIILTPEILFFPQQPYKDPKNHSITTSFISIPEDLQFNNEQR